MNVACCQKYEEATAHRAGRGTEFIVFAGNNEGDTWLAEWQKCITSWSAAAADGGSLAFFVSRQWAPARVCVGMRACDTHAGHLPPAHLPHLPRNSVVDTPRT